MRVHWRTILWSHLEVARCGSGKGCICLFGSASTGWHRFLCLATNKVLQRRAQSLADEVRKDYAAYFAAQQRYERDLEALRAAR